MDKEIVLENSVMIVSETDEKGNIIYANEDFCQVCGYTKDELIGKPHNIVRHKDMPKVAFQDLWDTIKTGAEWRGIVKNISKNGDYYWVKAYVYSVEENGKRRYISVRTKPKKSEVETASTLYKTIR